MKNLFRTFVLLGLTVCVASACLAWTSINSVTLTVTTTSFSCSSGFDGHLAGTVSVDGVPMGAYSEIEVRVYKYGNMSTPFSTMMLHWNTNGYTNNSPVSFSFDTPGWDATTYYVCAVGFDENGVQTPDQDHLQFIPAEGCSATHDPHIQGNISYNTTYQVIVQAAYANDGCNLVASANFSTSGTNIVVHPAYPVSPRKVAYNSTEKKILIYYERYDDNSSEYSSVYSKISGQKLGETIINPT